MEFGAMAFQTLFSIAHF